MRWTVDGQENLLWIIQKTAWIIILFWEIFELLTKNDAEISGFTNFLW